MRIYISRTMPTKSEYTLGLTFIFLCAAIWAGASVLIQYIYEDLDFRSPFFLTYIATSLLTAHLPFYYIYHWIKDKMAGPSLSSNDGGLLDSETEHDTIALHELSVKRSVDASSQFFVQDWQIIKIASIISPIWFLTNCLYNYSLLMTSVSSSTIISNLSASFTLFFSWYMSLEEVTYVKIIGMFVCFAGAVAVGLQDEDNSQSQSAGGDIIALISSVGYGVYTTVIKYYVPEDKDISMQLLLGYVGLVNAILLLPALLIMVGMKWGNINQLTGEAFGFIALNGFSDTVVADYFWARAVLLTSPTVATIGMSITIPLALMTDLFINGLVPTYISILGSLSVIAGFILVNLSQEQEQMIIEKLRRLVGYEQIMQGETFERNVITPL